MQGPGASGSARNHRGPRATHLTTEARAHRRSQGGGGVRAAAGPPQRPPPAPAPCAGDPTSGADGSWRTSCRPALRLGWSRRPGSPAGNISLEPCFHPRRAGHGATARSRVRRPRSGPGATRQRAGREPAELRTGLVRSDPGSFLPHAAGPSTATQSREDSARMCRAGASVSRTNHCPWESAPTSDPCAFLPADLAQNSAVQVGGAIPGQPCPLDLEIGAHW